MKFKTKLNACATVMAAAMTFAGQADAQTWTRYIATGTGMRGDTDPFTPGFSAYAVNFTLTFSVISGPAGIYPGYSMTGTRFTVRNQFEESVYDAGVPGVLTATYRLTIPSAGANANFTINYADDDGVAGFPLALDNNTASGSFSYRSGDYVSNRFLTVFGNFTNFYVAGETTGYESIAFQTSPVPEPATWGLMLAGFGIMGAAMRTRRRSAAVTFA